MQNLNLHTSMINSLSGFQRSLDEARYVVVGVPYDHTSTYRSGSRFAPRAIREASINIETYSLRTHIDIENVPIHDAGDLHVLSDLVQTLGRLTKVTEEILSAKKVPICIGGEHTITLGPVRSLPRNVGVISFDAHADLRDEYGGGKLSHATVLRRMSEILGTDGIFLCGVRALCKEEVELIDKTKIQHLTPWAVREVGTSRAAERLRDFARAFPNMYVTIDSDVLDPAFAPGVANPEFEGLTPDELMTLLLAVVDEKLLGFDLVEVCPDYDTGATAIAAARVIFEVIAKAERAKRGLIDSS